MHVLKIIHGYPPDYNAGSEVYSKHVCEELSHSHQVSVFTREENPFQPCFQIRCEIVNSNLTIYRVNNPQGKDGYRHMQMDLAFRDLVKDLRPDVTHIGHLNHLSTGIVDILNQLKIPILFTLHDFWLMCPRGQFLTRGIGQNDNFKLCSGQEDSKCSTSCYSVYFSGTEYFREKDERSWTSWISNRMKETRGIVQKVDKFISPSKYLMNRFIDEFEVPSSKMSYLDYGFPGYLKPPSPETNTRPFTFGYIGTHIAAKGVNLLIQAFNRLDGDAQLKIYGRDIGQPTRALKKLASASSNSIEFCGEYQNDRIVGDVFSKVDCIVVPSIWGENSPLVIHEAQACGVPVITSEFGGMAEYVEHEVNGLLFEHRSADSLVGQMEYAISNPERMAELGSRGYLFDEYGKVPGIQSHCKELEKLYQEIIVKDPGLWRITLDTNPEDCNLKCIMCEEHSPYSDFIPNLYKNTGVKRRRMSFETVENLFQQANDLGIKEIIPSTMGEPLLYKGIEGIFQLAEATGVKLNLTTNGTFPKKDVESWADLIVPNTSDVKISWNGATKETAEFVMTGIDFDDAIDKLKRFIARRDRIHQETNRYCSVTLQLTFMDNNMHELSDIVKLAAELNVDRVKGHHLWAHFDEIKDLSMKSSVESIVKWNGYVRDAHRAAETYLRPNGEEVKLENIERIAEVSNGQIPEDYECPFLGKELWVSATGKISPCCAPDKMRAELGDFGNIEDVSLREVLRSESYQALCKNYQSRSLCSTCNMRRP
jgi:glycosyltransferase involved in cell wall biosynthesis/MoaA/NifB/PqqE/SkfB family radical SAM enzyme